MYGSLSVLLLFCLVEKQLRCCNTIDVVVVVIYLVVVVLPVYAGCLKRITSPLSVCLFFCLSPFVLAYCSFCCYLSVCPSCCIGLFRPATYMFLGTLLFLLSSLFGIAKEHGHLFSTSWDLTSICNALVFFHGKNL